MAEKKVGKKATKAANRAEKNAGADATVLAKIAAMPAPFPAMGERLHALILRSAPGLQPTSWYGMPAYAKDGKTVCFFQDAHKFKSRYATLGFSDKASLDEGAIWPVAFAVKELTPEAEGIIRALLKRALGL